MSDPSDAGAGGAAGIAGCVNDGGADPEFPLPAPQDDSTVETVSAATSEIIIGYLGVRIPGIGIDNSPH
jgi:hypothetical protein